MTSFAARHPPPASAPVSSPPADFPTRLLRERGLRSTPVRRAVLQRLDHGAAAVPLSAFSEAVDADRITLYRTLRTFEDLGIIHRVPDADGGPQYALCGGACTPEAHTHHPPHFQCGDCGQTYCLPEVRASLPVLPEGYRARETRVTYEGTCATCADAP